jgi:hypothetical protein
MSNTVNDGNVRWAGPLGDIQLPQVPAPERVAPERTGEITVPPAPLGSGLQPKTENNLVGQLGDFKLSATQG